MQDKTYNADVPLSSDEVQVSGSSSQDSLSPRKKMPRLESNLLKDANEESDEAEDTDAQSDWAYGGDTFLERSDYGLIRWYPEDPHSFLSDDSSHCDYQLMTHLYHTIHLDEFFKTQINQHFIMKDLVRGPNREKIKGFYLRTRSEEQPPHNKYGNCSYYIKFMSLVELCLENNIRQFYLLDACQSNNKCATRYLITDNTERFFKHQWAFDCRGYGGSWHAIPGPLWYEHKYARYIRGFRSNQDWPVLHELEFFVSIADALRDALFSRCKAKCEEHAESNNEDNCYRYRNGSAEDWLICPYPYSKQETLNELKRFVRTDGTLCRSFS
ncbi:uncharacterized protein LOC135198590 [Macrobrachium nipponense]|uniref:uncharacterized protein LOC135198590 n=1 Tax=Macrobrachium nipponense TaxID=159736 RepID=UPI0030C800EA